MLEGECRWKGCVWRRVQECEGKGVAGVWMRGRQEVRGQEVCE